MGRVVRSGVHHGVECGKGLDEGFEALIREVRTFSEKVNHSLSCLREGLWGAGEMQYVFRGFLSEAKCVSAHLDLGGAWVSEWEPSFMGRGK